MDLTKMFSDPLYSGFQNAITIFGKDNAALLERIYALETAHFTSTQFINGYSPGMVDFNKGVYPYGWTTLQSYWDTHPWAKPKGVWSTTVNGIPFSYVKFPSFRAALMATGLRLSQDGWDANKWNGDTTGAYGQNVDKITNTYVV